MTLNRWDLYFTLDYHRCLIIKMPFNSSTSLKLGFIGIHPVVMWQTYLSWIWKRLLPQINLLLMNKFLNICIILGKVVNIHSSHWMLFHSRITTKTQMQLFFEPVVLLNECLIIYLHLWTHKTVVSPLLFYTSQKLCVLDKILWWPNS